MFKSESIHSDGGNYTLSVLKDEGGYSMPVLSRDEDSISIFTWDNGEYLSKHLIAQLRLQEPLEDLYNYIPKKDFHDVLEMLLEGVKCGWFEEKEKL